MNDVAKIFVGCAPNYEDAESQAVLEWSIRKHATIEVEITWMHLTTDEDSPFYGWETHHWATPFSGFRWAVPELCNFEGRGIYCDSDVIFLADVRELWEQQNPLPAGKVAIGRGGAEWRMCVCLFDCEKAKPHMIPIEKLKQDSNLHPSMNRKFRDEGLVQTFIGAWNSLDRENMKLSEAKVLHYTCMNNQPQLEYALPRLEKAGMKHWFDGITGPHPREDVRKLFKELLIEATLNGFPISNYMQHVPYGVIDKRSFKNRARV